MIGLLSFGIFRLIESYQDTGNAYAKVYYQNELILMVDLNSLDYRVYDTEFKDQIDVGQADKGIFYVPGKITSDMQDLYAVDQYAKDKGIVGIKLVVKSGSIKVAYQESPQNICQIQGPSSSALNPIVCLPNELVINIYTNLQDDVLIPDSVV